MAAARVFHDFSSNKHGDLIGWLQESERLSFREAVERLAAEAGLALPAADPRAAAEESRRASLHDWMERAAGWFEAELRRPVGAAARAYLAKRGLPETEWSRFRLGYAPGGRTALKDHLVARGAQPGELVEAGLLIATDEGQGAPYDRFRDRITFPITDGRGRIVSFGGRALDPEARAKYLNGPETAIFHKGRTLYGLPEARRLLHAAERESGGEGAPLVVVEGYFDVIACRRAQVAAVAPMGTALAEEQMELLWRQHPEPTLCFDGDGAGKRAAARAIDRALPLLQPGRSFRFALVSGGKDPDDVLRDQGEAALKAQLTATRPFVDVLFERERDAAPLDTPEAYAGLKARLRRAASSIADKDLAPMYREALQDRFETLRALSRPAATVSDAGRQLQSYRRRGLAPRAAAGPPTAEAAAAARRLTAAPEVEVAAVVHAALADPERLDRHLEPLQAHGFGDLALGELAGEIVAARLFRRTLDSGSLLRHLARLGYGELLSDIAGAASRSSAPFLDAGLSLADARSQWSEAFERLIRLAVLETALQSAKAAATDRLDRAAYWGLKTERDALKRAIKEQYGRIARRTSTSVS